MGSDMASELNGILVDLGEAQDRMHAAYHRASELSRGIALLPAPALTEDAIVAALGEDATMAGRIIARLSVRWSTVQRANAAAGAKNQVSDYSGPGSCCLQSLAVALAAASYRG